MNENYDETVKGLDLARDQLKQLAINAFEASWLTAEAKSAHVTTVKNYFSSLNLPLG